jgi:ribosomal-protein-alanine acetyltransferase
MMITYRNLNLVDALAVFDLEKEIFGTDAWTLAQIKEELSGSRRLYLAALDDENIVGYAGIAANGESADIHNVAVRERYRRQGIARRLIARLEKWAKDQGAISAILEMRVGNQEALPLYLSLGYKEISRRKDYYASGVDAIVMQKDLTGDEAKS